MLGVGVFSDVVAELSSSVSVAATLVWRYTTTKYNYVQ